MQDRAETPLQYFLFLHISQLLGRSCWTRLFADLGLLALGLRLWRIGPGFGLGALRLRRGLNSALRTDEAEAAHGTVTRHYRLHQQGKPASTNPIVSIFARTQGLIFRGRMDTTPDVVKFAETLEEVCVDDVEPGRMTKDLAVLIRADHTFLSTDEFMSAVDAELKRRMK